MTIVLIVGALIAVAALTVLIISLMKLNRNKGNKGVGSAKLPEGANSREAFYAAGETSERRTVIGAGMPPYVTDSISEQKTVGGPGVPYGGGMPVNQPSMPQTGGMPFSGMSDFEGRTVSVRDMNNANGAMQQMPVQQATGGSSYPYAQAPQPQVLSTDPNGTVDVRSRVNQPVTQVDRYSYGQPQSQPAYAQPQNQPAYGQPQGQQGQGTISEMVIRYTLPGRGEQVQRFSHPQEITIGRDSGNKLVLPFESISNHHARIDCVGTQAFITNLSRPVNGLVNELTVNLREVMNQRTPLTNGCQINLGMVPMTVTWTVGGAPAGGIMSNLDGMTVRPGRGVNDDWTVRGNDGMLIVSWELSGRRNSKRVNLQNSVVIGRDPVDTVCIDDTTRTVSKHHLIVTRNNGGQLIVRNGSRINPQYGKNPFFVQGQRVVDEIPFTDGMTIKAGQAQITLTLEGGI